MKFIRRVVQGNLYQVNLLPDHFLCCAFSEPALHPDRNICPLQRVHLKLTELIGLKIIDNQKIRNNLIKQVHHIRRPESTRVLNKLKKN